MGVRRPSGGAQQGARARRGNAEPLGPDRLWPHDGDHAIRRNSVLPYLINNGVDKPL
jgi:hypothetical protein